FRFTLRCKIDSTEICTSTDVRTINGSSYVCVDPTIWSRMNIKTKEMSSKMKFVDEVTQILADVHCKCGLVIGTVMKYAGTYLPTLNIGNLMFSERIEGQDAPLEAITNWSKAKDRFWIPEATEHELRQMLVALNAENSEGKIELDVMCDKMIAIQEKLLEKERKRKEEMRRIKTECGTYLPTLNIGNLMFSERIEGQDAPLEAITNWSKAKDRFWIPEATEHELRQMLVALNAENSEGKIELDVMCDKMIAIQEKLLEKERKRKEEMRRIKTEW
ncbi:hypothetical protein COOONC_04386, partial [Cooperia oncophora]